MVAPLQNQISGGGMLVKGTHHFGAWAQALRQRVRHIGQRVSRTAGHHKLTLAKQRFRLMPFGDIRERIHTNQQEKLVDWS